ncbi:GAF domain-containing protein [Paracoccus tibetensis]|uniref:GAF domain-containing protein n=1 Tax=Paracoccus tibetensis TaxID=336292 RepID=UPI000B857201|nr:GAF domain-containing protein [Paracoccus tibetensis]
MDIVDRQRDPELDALCDEARAIFLVPHALVSLIDATRQVFLGRSGLERSETPRSMSFCNYAILGDDVFVVEDAHADPRFMDNPLVTGEPFIRFYAGAPLVYLKDIRLGALCLLDSRPRKFTLGERAELAAMAEAAVSILVSRAFPDRLEAPPR